MPTGGKPVSTDMVEEAEPDGSLLLFRKQMFNLRKGRLQ
jgi:hypothetical protein